MPHVRVPRDRMASCPSFGFAPRIVLSTAYFSSFGPAGSKVGVYVSDMMKISFAHPPLLAQRFRRPRHALLLPRAPDGLGHVLLEVCGSTDPPSGARSSGSSDCGPPCNARDCSEDPRVRHEPDRARLPDVGSHQGFCVGEDMPIWAHGLFPEP